MRQVGSTSSSSSSSRGDAGAGTHAYVSQQQCLAHKTYHSPVQCGA
jgi:hypothetical protein